MIGSTLPFNIKSFISQVSIGLSLIVFTSLAVAESLDRSVITSPQDLKQLIEENNIEIKLLRERVIQVQSVTDGVRGAYNPVLSTGAHYSDDEREPTSSFQPARVKNEHLEISLRQRTTAGIAATVGFTNDRTELFQSQPPNNLLPYPATFKQPVMFVKLEADILENFMGYISRKQLEQVELDEEVAKTQLLLVKDQLYLTSSSLFWNLQVLEEMKTLIGDILARLHELESDVLRKSERSIAEPSDVYKLKASIAKRELDILGIDKSIENFKNIISQLVSDQGSVLIVPSQQLPNIRDQIIQCENKILSHRNLDPSWSKQFAVLDKMIERASLEKNISHRQVLPNINLFASYAQTGTDTDKDESFSEMLHGDRPQSMVGVNFTLELAPSLLRAAKISGNSVLESSTLSYSSFNRESITKFLHTKEIIKNLRREDELIATSIEHEFKQMKDMNRQYKQGRISLFELVKEEGEALGTKLREKELWAQRIENVYQFLGHFDGFKCENIN